MTTRERHFGSTEEIVGVIYLSSRAGAPLSRITIPIGRGRGTIG
jgi:hypothetical protein